MTIDQASQETSHGVMLIEVYWRVPFIDFIKDQKLPPSIDQKSVEAARIIRQSKGYVVVGDKLYKRGSTIGVLMKCIPTDEVKEILQEIHDGTCGNHTESRTLVSKAFRYGFYWLTALADGEELVRQCTNCQLFGKQAHVPVHNLITIPPS
ncbi:uncharacterized protein LOC112896803 [Panicum hallii]|uniref:uncharacterized protein LOC112896803 n=1 Tax=Panicum hallii TaxID=206008 RepID=UPI000DF4E4C9|nr:uncharacterized protein LOC112896803 [Panicum hallii]